MGFDTPRGRPPSALVVDDYPDAAASLALLLSYAGFPARVALTGKDALSGATTEPPDVVIVEPRMPGGGWDLVRQLAGPFAGRRPLLVALSTDSTTSARAAAAAAGVDRYLVKPAELSVLLAALEQIDPGAPAPPDLGVIPAAD